jgi:hypothetical protein
MLMVKKGMCKLAAAASVAVGLAVYAIFVPAAAYASTAPSIDYLAINSNPVDWSIIMSNFTTKQGQVVPFRMGQEDMPNGEAGFGYRHIEKVHGFPPLPMIQEALHEGKCVSPTLGRWTCTSDEVEMGYNMNVDPRSGDNLPVGIMTVYYKAPCAC